MSVADDSIRCICSDDKSAIPYITQEHELLVYEENVILSELNKDKKFNFKQLQNYARFYYAHQRDFPLIFYRVYPKLKKENNFTYDRMKALIKEELDKIKAEVEMKSYVLYFPINVKSESKFEKFRLNECEIDFVDDIEELSETEKKQEKKVNKILNSKFLLCKITLKGRNCQYVFMKSQKVYEFMLGLIGFYETYDVGSRIAIGIQKPISKLRYHDILIFENKKFIQSVTYDKNGEEGVEKIELNEDRCEKINSDVKRVIKSKQRELMLKLYTVYLIAITEKNFDWSFLSFWRVIELAILKEPSQSQFEVTNISKAIINKLKSSTEYKLDRFHELRNDFVHEETSNIGEYDRNELKFFAQTFIDICISLLRNYSTDEINLFYYYVKKKNRINEHLKMAEKVKSLIEEAKRNRQFFSLPF